MKVAKIEFDLARNSLGKSVVATVYDESGRQIHKKAAEYKSDPNQGIAMLMDYMCGVMRENFKEKDGSLSFTWHKESAQ